MPHFNNHLNILLMPTDACNMNCVYCFHKPYHLSVDKMNFYTLKQSYDIVAPNYKSINIIWHGGEPLMMGLDFYKKALELQKNYECTFKNSIQSNLTLLTNEMADFFVSNSVNVSTSFDGVCNHITRGHDDTIMKGRQMIIDRGKNCGVLMVVSNKNIDRLIDSYELFKQRGINFSLNLYLTSKNAVEDVLKLDTIHAIQRINELFDYWLLDKYDAVKIRYFQSIIDYLLFEKKSICTYTSCLGRWIAIRHDGEIVPCNRTFPKEYSYGNVFDYSNIGDAFESDGFKHLIQDAIIRREKCKDCFIYNFCNGGCNNVALNENGIQNNMGQSCEILLGVYNHIESTISNIHSMNIESLNPIVINALERASVQKVNKS